MYPVELEIKDTTESNTSASYLDLPLSIGRDGQLRTSLYDKRDDFSFHITNCPFLSSNIPSSPAYGVFISRLIPYDRACYSYECFMLRMARLSSKLIGQGHVRERLKSSLRKFYDRYGDLIKNYEVCLSQMLHAIMEHDNNYIIQWHINWIDITPICELITELYLISDFDLTNKFREVSIEHCNGCGWSTEDAYSSWHLVLFHLGLAFVLMLRPFTPGLVMFSDFEFRTSLSTSFLLNPIDTERIVQMHVYASAAVILI